MRPALRGVLLALLALALASCRKAQGPDAPLRLGFFPNVTHAQALVGNDEGVFREALGGRLTTLQFNAGPAAMEGLLARAVDVCYVGAGPAITAYVRSGGELKVIAGAASGGSVLVARTATTPAQLAGKRVAVPQLGNTQDIALRWWLSTQGLKPTSLGGGNVMVLPQPNPEIMTLFKRKEIEAAWVPEPWASRLLAEGGHVLVDERTLWPGGRFPTTVLVATRDALEHRREDVKAVLRAHLQLTARARASEAPFAKETNDAFARVTGRPMSQSVLEQSFSRLEFTADPMRAQLATVAEHSSQLGYIPKIDASEMVDDSLLRELQAEEGVGGAGR